MIFSSSIDKLNLFQHKNSSRKDEFLTFLAIFEVESKHIFEVFDSMKF